MSDQDSFWGSGPSPAGGEPDVRGGRYHLTDPATGEPADYTRASNVGAVITDRFAIERWRTRTLLRGLAARPDALRLLLASVELDDAKCDELAEQALTAARAQERANDGTTAHEVHRRVDEGLPMPEEFRHHAEGYQAMLARYGLTVLVREARVINRRMGVAGRLDGLAREADGTLVVVDEKGTRHLTLAAPEFAPQLACYATAEWIELSGDGNGWTRMGPVRTDYAIALHVDQETGAVAPYRVDLLLGAYGANLSNQVREYRRLGRTILSAYVPPGDGRPEARHASTPAVGGAHSLDDGCARGPGGEHLGPINPGANDPFANVPNADDQASPVPPLIGETRVLDGRVTQWTADGWHDCGPAEADRTEQASAEAAAAFPTAGNEGNGVAPPVGNACARCGQAQQTRDRLKKLDKAGLQALCKAHGVTGNLARNKDPLIDYLRDAGHVAGEQPGAAPTATRTPDLGDPQELPAGPVTPDAEDPTDPRTDAFRRARVSEIVAAPSVAELATIHRRVVRQGGAQAWTENMTEAARMRAAALDADPRQVALSRIVKCTSQAQLRDLWDELTVGGTRPEGWPPEATAAGEERLRQLTAAAGMGPGNPFGPEATGPGV